MKNVVFFFVVVVIFFLSAAEIINSKSKYMYVLLICLGRMENTEIRNRNRNRNLDRNWRNKWMLQVGKYDSHQNSSSLLCIPRKVDDDTRNSFKKRYVYIEHSSYHSFQLNWVTQNIFAFVGHSNTEELVEMWIRVKNFWLLNLCKTKTLTL